MRGVMEEEEMRKSDRRQLEKPTTADGPIITWSPGELGEDMQHDKEPD